MINGNSVVFNRFQECFIVLSYQQKNSYLDVMIWLTFCGLQVIRVGDGAPNRMGEWALHMGRGSGDLLWRYANPIIFFKGALCFQCNMSIIFRYFMFKSLFSTISWDTREFKDRSLGLQLGKYDSVLMKLFN